MAGRTYRTYPAHWERDPTPPPPRQVWVRHLPTRQLYPVPWRTWDDFLRGSPAAARELEEMLEARESRTGFAGALTDPPPFLGGKKR